MEISSVLIAVVAGVAGVATVWGVLRARVGRNTSDIKKLVPKAECEIRHDGIKESLDSLGNVVNKQQSASRQFRNFALYQLTKDGVSLADAKDIMENGGD